MDFRGRHTGNCNTTEPDKYPSFSGEYSSIEPGSFSYRFNSNGTIDYIVEGTVEESASYSTDGTLLFIGEPSNPFEVEVFAVTSTYLYLFEWMGDPMTGFVLVKKFLKT